MPYENTRVPRLQDAAPAPMLDRPTPQPERLELLSCHDSVLLGSDEPDQPILMEI